MTDACQTLPCGVVGTQTSERLDVPISWDDLIRTILCNKGDQSQKINSIETLQSPFKDTFVYGHFGNTFEQILVIGISARDAYCPYCLLIS